MRCYEAAQRLLLYRDLWQAPVGQAWLRLLAGLEAGEAGLYGVYSEWLLGLGGGSWAEWLWQGVAGSENPFAWAAARGEMTPRLAGMAAYDLPLLQCCANCREELEGALGRAGLPIFPQPPTPTPDWARDVASLIAFYRQQGAGFWGRYRVGRWHQGQCLGIPDPDPVRLEDLWGWEQQKKLLVHNTQALVQGLPALHVLLYGARGTGKSSLVKAVAQAFAQQGLRLLEVARDDLLALPQILESLGRDPHAFILFVDDLAFEETEGLFRPLKVLLEGDVARAPARVRVYATSNRRHLIRETFADRPSPAQTEVHAWDTLQEKLSLADRFGLTLTFPPWTQGDYLATVAHLAGQAGIERQDLQAQALKWAQHHHGFSGRSAQQFLTALQAGLI
ncbi:MAG: ATP-binding protein [Thermostichales cyanobacterium SRBZ-1_bins_19]